MAEDPNYPYNLPPWRRSYEAASPDGQWCARVEDTWEIYMSGPTKGTLIIEGLFQILDCSPIFIWSSDSQYLAVPQWKYWFRRRERLLILDTKEKIIHASRSIYQLLILNDFDDGILTGIDSPVWKPKKVKISVHEALAKYKKIEQSHIEI